MLSVIFFSVIGLSVLIALAARLASSKMTIGEFLVGGRSFPA
jgi:SSS family solute:Na+ symporter